MNQTLEYTLTVPPSGDEVTLTLSWPGGARVITGGVDAVEEEARAIYASLRLDFAGLAGQLGDVRLAAAAEKSWPRVPGPGSRGAQVEALRYLPPSVDLRHESVLPCPLCGDPAVVDEKLAQEDEARCATCGCRAPLRSWQGRALCSDPQGG